MTPRSLYVLFIQSLVYSIGHGQNTTDNLQYVDQLIGSANGGEAVAISLLTIS